MFDFFIAEPDKRFQRHLVTEPVILTDFQHLGVNETFRKSENLGVGPALDLADESFFIVGKGGEYGQ